MSCCTPALRAPCAADRRSDNWTLYPYCYERSTQQFAERLGLDGERDVRPFVKQGGAELLNDKRVFRSVAAGRGVSIAEARVRDAVGTRGMRASLIDVTGAVIVKQDRHSGGFGNLVDQPQRRRPTRLARPEVLLAQRRRAVPRPVRIAWTRLAYAEHTPLIVEVYYPVTAASPRVQGRCGEQRRHVPRLRRGAPGADLV